MTSRKDSMPVQPDPNLPRPSNLVATWDETFMAMAEVIRNRSKDPNTQAGATLVSRDNRVLSLGYNGAPNGFHDSEFPWGRDGEDPLETKYPYVIHAERNAVLNFRGSLRELAGATAYVTHFPCNECAKELIQVGVRRVVYREPWDTAVGLVAASIRLFEMTGVVMEHMPAQSAVRPASWADRT